MSTNVVSAGKEVLNSGGLGRGAPKGMDSDTRELLRVSLRHTLTETSTRSLGERLAELGWDDVLADDAPAALGLLFEIKGDTVANADALGVELSRCLAAASGDPALASVVVGFPGVSTLIEAAGNVTISGMVAAFLGGASSVAVICGEAGAERLAILPVGTVFASKPCHISDPSLELVRLTATVPSAKVQWLSHEVAATVLACARALLSTEMVGLAAHVIASAVAYTGQRVQYGKAIGTFQALQHRIASAHAFVTGARHLADAARETNDPWTALVAKAMAGQAAETACVQAQQCYGAIGFTWEHEFHRYLKRAYALDWIAGDWRSLESQIGATLQATGVVPHIGSL
jgi:Acyl-CoA dehydrogenase, C-terminal domain